MSEEPETIVTGTVDDISDAILLGRAVRGCRPRGAGYWLRWTAVADQFALGSTYAGQLCRRYGVDPNESINARGKRKP